MLDSVRDLVSILGIFGIPSIFVISTACIKSCHKFAKQLKVLVEAQQAQMRSQLLKDYKTYMAAGWVDMDDLVDWENSYQKYHMLGQNGIMDKKRDQLLSLPNTPR